METAPQLASLGFPDEPCKNRSSLTSNGSYLPFSLSFVSSCLVPTFVTLMSMIVTQKAKSLKIHQVSLGKIPVLYFLIVTAPSCVARPGSHPLWDVEWVDECQEDLRARRKPYFLELKMLEVPCWSYNALARMKAGGKHANY